MFNVWNSFPICWVPLKDLTQFATLMSATHKACPLSSGGIHSKTVAVLVGHCTNIPKRLKFSVATEDITSDNSLPRLLTAPSLRCSI